MSAPAERPWTPGPWAWRTTALSGKSGHDGEFVINYRLASAGDVGIRICVADTIRKSDAALIALAPELVEALEELLGCALSADESRLLMVGTNAGAMARDTGPGNALHARCDRIAEASAKARALISRLPQGGAS